MDKKDPEQSLLFDQRIIDNYATKYSDFAKRYCKSDQSTEKLREMEALSTPTGMEYIKAKEELEIAKILLGR